jgi:predicted nucleotidyltransferase
MISATDKARIAGLCEKYRVSKALLFGSSASGSAISHDIDLAVAGVAPSQFFRFYGELMFSLSKPVDLVDLSRESSFTRLILAEGIPVYG